MITYGNVVMHTVFMNWSASPDTFVSPQMVGAMASGTVAFQINVTEPRNGCKIVFLHYQNDGVSKVGTVTVDGVAYPLGTIATGTVLIPVAIKYYNGQFAVTVMSRIED